MILVLFFFLQIIQFIRSMICWYWKVKFMATIGFWSHKAYNFFIFLDKASSVSIRFLLKYFSFSFYINFDCYIIYATQISLCVFKDEYLLTIFFYSWLFKHQFDIDEFIARENDVVRNIVLDWFWKRWHCWKFKSTFFHFKEVFVLKMVFQLEIQI